MSAFLPQETPTNAARASYGALTLKQVFRAVLYDLNKVANVNFRVPDFNHFYRRGVMAWKQKRQNIYDSSQQTTDDLRSLAVTRIITASSAPALNVVTQSFTLPADYSRTTGVVVNFKVLSDFLAFKTNDVIHYPCDRLTSDKNSAIINDYFQRPSYERPFFYVRKPFLEIRSGIHSRLRLDSVVFEYLQQAEELVLLQTQIDDDTTDTSPRLEYSPEACDEIAKEIAILYMENTTDQRLRTYPQVSTTVPASPPTSPQMAAQQRQQQQAGADGYAN